METVPIIDRDALVAELKRRLPRATVRWLWVNRGYGSWTIDIACGPNRVEIAWGPLSGFGATDRNNLRENTNLFGAFDWPLDSLESAVEFAVRICRSDGQP